MTINGTMSLSQKQEGASRAPAQKAMRVYEYFEEIKQEFFKISWTEGEEVMTYAKAVVGSTFVFGMLIYVADLIVHRALFGLDSIFKLLIG